MNGELLARLLPNVYRDIFLPCSYVSAFWFADASLSMWSVKAYYTLWPDVCVCVCFFLIVNVECESKLHFVTRRVLLFVKLSMRMIFDVYVAINVKILTNVLTMIVNFMNFPKTRP